MILLLSVTWVERFLRRTIEMMQLLVNVQHDEKKKKRNKRIKTQPKD